MTRMSTTRSDPGYDAWTLAEKPIAVLLDGSFVGLAVTADEDTGEVLCLVTKDDSASEWVRNADGLLMRRLTGQVTILTGPDASRVLNSCTKPILE